MKLVQRKQGLPTFEFDVNDEVIFVTTKSLTGGSRFEIPLMELSTRTSSYTHIPVLWYCFAVFMWLCTAVSAFGVFGSGQLPDKAGAGILFVVCASVAMISSYEAVRWRADCILFHWESGGDPAIRLHRKIPSERHVQEYVEIVKERILVAKKNAKENA